MPRPFTMHNPHAQPQAALSRANRLSCRLVTCAALALAATTVLSGCAAFAVGGATAAGASLAYDRRTSNAVLADESIEMKAVYHLSQDDAIRAGVHVNITAYNGQVLVTGEAPDASLGNKVIEVIRNLPDVKLVYNRLTIAEPSSLQSRSNDTLITAKVKTALFEIRDLPGFGPMQVKVVTEEATVYLMGLVYPKEADAAAEKARRVNDVKRVVKLFEYID